MQELEIDVRGVTFSWHHLMGYRVDSPID